MKVAFVVLSDPDTGSEEVLGRLFNAFAAAYDFKQHGDDITILFMGTGTRWASRIVENNHPVHGLYQLLKNDIAGVSCACADVFGASEAAQKSGYELLKGNAIPGTSGLPSLRNLSAEGYTILTY